MTPWLIVSACALAWALTGLMRRYALSTRLLDVPNERSSHRVATPRGGGVAIVVTTLAAVGLLFAHDLVPRPLALALLGSGALVAIVGAADDRWQLPAGWRFLGHLVAAAWVLMQLGPLPPVPAFGVEWELGWLGLALAGGYVAWSINFFNFMDGIDGIASVEAITVALGGALAGWLAWPDSPWLVPTLFAAAVFGFLVWNRPPARIFMGDAGSGFLGVVVAVMSIWYGYQQPQLFWSWFVLQGCFMVDASTTLVRRVYRGERATQAHRTHAYQYAARRHGSHGIVTAAVGAITVAWLLPIAALVATGRVDGMLGVAIAYAPLLPLAYRYRAGARELQEV